MDTICDIQYKDIGFKPLRQEFRDLWSEFLEINGFYGTRGKIVINTAPNRIGKTVTTLDYLANEIIKKSEQVNIYGNYNVPKVLYLTDRHKQITEVKKTLKNLGHDNFKQIYGMERICSRKHDPTINFLIKSHITSTLICQNCYLKENCLYWTQFHFQDGEIIGSPKELVATKHLKKSWNYIVLDEVIDKANKISPTCPEISEQAFNDYDLTDDIYYTVYTDVHEFIENIDEYSKSQMEIKQQTQMSLNFEPYPIRHINETTERYDLLKTTIEKIRIGALNKLIKIVTDNPMAISKDSGALISFFTGLNSTMEWLDYCFDNGFRTHFYKPYLHYVLDLKKEYSSDIIILNTSLETHIYNSLVSYYPSVTTPLFDPDYIDITKPSEFGYPVTNKGSMLLHYNMNGQSCSKSAIFETDEKGHIILGKNGIPHAKGYGKEIDISANMIAKFCKEKDLKVGLITFKGAEKLLKDYPDVVGHFGGHQGSNAFDDVDILIIVGTYHLNPTALYQKHYIIHNEFLKDNPAKWNNRQYINGVMLNFTDNKKLNAVKLYKLNEEHEQAIFRSGALVDEGKIVIVFGYVPKGIENKLDYRTFSTPQGAKISITRMLKKRGNS